MTEHKENGVVVKTVRGILQVLIPIILSGWAGTYVAVRVALAHHEQQIQTNSMNHQDFKREVKDDFKRVEAEIDLNQFNIQELSKDLWQLMGKQEKDKED